MTQKYYLVDTLRGPVPVRVTLDAAGNRIEAAAPDEKTGLLATVHPEWGRLDRKPPDLIEIDQAEFERRCAAAPKKTH